MSIKLPLVMRRSGAFPDSLHKLIVTLAIWLAYILLIEFSPGRKTAPVEPSLPPVE
jgi:hypothetical protein